jgi:hypothetical protein
LLDGTSVNILPRMRAIATSILALAIVSAAADSASPIRLFREKGMPSGWVIRQMRDVSKPASSNARWFVNEQGILTGSDNRDTWILSEKEYGDFELELEFKLTALGNSGVALRAPMQGDPAYDGLELQMVDPRYYEGKGAPEQLCGAIYRGIPAKKDVFKAEDWNKYKITCQGPRVKVVLNGEVIQDFNLDEETKTLRRDAADKTAPPLKERPRKGHIGFQDLSRDGGHAQIRNVTLRVLDKAAPAAK